jgi:hypothetical protein
MEPLKHGISPKLPTMQSAATAAASSTSTSSGTGGLPGAGGMEGSDTGSPDQITLPSGPVSQLSPDFMKKIIKKTLHNLDSLKENALKEKLEDWVEQRTEENKPKPPTRCDESPFSSSDDLG